MKVLVLISGIADPKWPLPVPLDGAALQSHAQRYAVLSPFDEAALELALKLRDADPAVAIHAVVAGPEAIARQVAGWRLDSVRRLPESGLQAWDAVGMARSLAQALGSLAREADLILLGREFGDLDDGSLPPLLARALDLPHVALAFAVQGDGSALWVSRQRGGGMERLKLQGAAVLSITNDAGNRLRHPLLKNVMAARKLQFATLAAQPQAGSVSLADLAPMEAAARQRSCQMLEGSAQEQARALAQMLHERRSAS